jgi:hypothetical protein
MSIANRECAASAAAVESPTVARHRRCRNLDGGHWRGSAITTPNRSQIRCSVDDELPGDRPPAHDLAHRVHLDDPLPLDVPNVQVDLCVRRIVHTHRDAKRSRIAGRQLDLAGRAGPLGQQGVGSRGGRRFDDEAISTATSAVNSRGHPEAAASLATGGVDHSLRVDGQRTKTADHQGHGINDSVHIGSPVNHRDPQLQPSLPAEGETGPQ